MKNNSFYRYDIQSLRCVAVLSVLMFHFNKFLLPGGFIGVDMFFVISGYLITSIILRQKEKGSFSFVSFYLNRVKRIVPTYLLLLLAVALAAMVLFIPKDFISFRAILFHSLIFNSNNFLPTLINDYFGASAEQTPLLHTWTLSIEMQFYLLLPVVLFFIPRTWNKYLLLILAILLTAYAQYKIQLGFKQEAYFSLLARTPEFLIGSLVILWRIEDKITPKIAAFLSIIGLALIVFSFVFINEGSDFPGFLSLIPCIGTAFLLLANGSWFNRAISVKPMVYIGELSYSIYLWHWPVLAFIRYYTDSYILPLKLAAFALLVIAILSWISYKFIEVPFRDLKSNKKMAVAFAIPMICLMVVGLVSKRVNNGILPIPDEIALPTALGLENHTNPGKIIVRGDTSASKEFLLIGDSHALHLNPFFEVIGKANHFKFRSITFDRFINVPTFNIESHHVSKIESEDWNMQQSVLKPIIKESKLIVIGGLWMNKDPERIKGLDSFFKSLAPDQQVVVVSDVPDLSQHPIKYGRFKGLGLPVEKSFRNLYQEADYTSLMNVIHKYPNVHFLDLRDSKLFGSNDFPFHNGQSLYYNTDHLNAPGSRLYGKMENEKVMKLLSTVL